MANCRITFAAIAAIIGLASFGFCADEAADLSDASVEQLIEQLGGEAFKQREAAADELVRRGLAIEPEIKAALLNPDLEIRLRAKQILGRLSQAYLEEKLAAFLEDVEGKEEHDLPTWKRFQESVGTDDATRKLFAEMVRAELQLLQQFHDNPESAAPEYLGRVQMLQQSTIPGLPTHFSSASLATLLFIGSDEKMPLSTTAGYQMYAHLNQPSAMQAVKEGEHSALMKKLLASWLEHGASNSSLARNGILLAQRFDLNETGLLLGRKLVDNQGAASYVLPYAILAIGQFGGKEDIQRLEPLLNNKTVCHSWHNPKFKDIIRIQVRDVALATLVHITGQKHKDYGFDLIRDDPRGLFYVYTVGFPEDDKRDAAFAKWDEWVKRQMQSELKPKQG